MLISSSLIFFCQSLETEELFQKGNSLLEEGHLLEAIDIYAEVVDVDSGHMNAYANRGLAHSYLEDYEQAIEDFTKALELDPTRENPELPTLSSTEDLRIRMQVKLRTEVCSTRNKSLWKGHCPIIAWQ